MEPGVSYAHLAAEAPDRFVKLRHELGVTTLGLNQIVLEPGQRGRIHSHEHQEEVYVVLEGTLTLVVEGEERDLAAGELARVAPPVRRQLANRGPGRCVVLAIGGASPHVSRDGAAYLGWEDAEGSPPQELPLPDDLPAAELRP